MTSLYIDTQVINYLRKSSSEHINSLLSTIKKRQAKYDLYYSVAHLGDYLRDSTEHKNYDLNFMNEIGINNFLLYNYQTRAISVTKRAPIDAFYNGRMTEEQYNQNYNENVKPKIDNHLIGLFKWYKSTLSEAEKDPLFVKTLDDKSMEVFNDLRRRVDVSSPDLTFNVFVNKIDEDWEQNVDTMSDKEASKYFISMNYLEGNLVSYKDQTFDLMRPNLTKQIKGTQFQKDFRREMDKVVLLAGLNYTNNFDQLYFFTAAYGSLQMLGIEKDRIKKFNVRSSVNDAGHFYFASRCDVLITEDDGLYRRAKILYGLFGISTNVYRIDEFVSSVL